MLGEKLHPSQTTNDQSIIRVTAVNTKTRDRVRSKTRDCFCCRSIESNEEMKTYEDLKTFAMLNGEPDRPLTCVLPDQRPGPRSLLIPEQRADDSTEAQTSRKKQTSNLN